ncbi:phenylalanine--tRNA ligase subunit beta [Candidatus Fermentibacteria bacterium]|nr:phenylalanine--tRNA ligase subunit beta [Candidatus Fermentibacteria bacterium]
MPKIEVGASDLKRLSGLDSLSPSDLEERLTLLKAEIDDWRKDTIKIELNDTNRPDLWSVEGVARALRCGERGRTDHLRDMPAPSRKVTVNAAMKGIRPYVACFRATGYSLDDPALEALIQSQEKLAESYGGKRGRAAIGFHRAEEISFPVSYGPAPPSTVFHPLGEEGEMELAEVLSRTEKGRQYAHLLEGMDLYPVLTDSSDEVFSFPPVINSNATGRVRPGDDDLFCDVTGTDWETVQLAATILACNLEDRGAEIEPLRTAYPYETPAGRSPVAPLLFADSLEAEKARMESVLGTTLSDSEISGALSRMDYVLAEVVDGSVRGVLPPYRCDGLHPVDMIEDVAIGRGYHSFQPVRLSGYTIGRVSPRQLLADELRTVLVGMGCEEILRPVLVSETKLRELTDTTGRAVRLANPMTAEYSVVRSSLLPGLLETESVSGHAAYPHRMFELGEVVRVDDDGLTASEEVLAFLACGNDVDLGVAHSILGGLCRARMVNLELEESEDRRFVPGRSALVRIDGEAAGMIGEVHPAVLDRWGIDRPGSAFEIGLATL